MPSSQPPLFVLSSGRTGSTLLARLLNRHPELLVVSDLFEPVGDEPYFHADRRVTGDEFWRVVSRPSLPQRIASWRRAPNAELLFLPDEDRLVSLLLSYTVPFLTDDPMGFYERLEEEVRRFPRDTMPGQLIRFFECLRDAFGKPFWVERTGGSLPHTGKILRLWPDARVVHSVRDPREVALSMMTGSFFRLYLELEKDPEMGPWDESFVPPVEEMGAMLDRWVCDAEAVFEAFDASRLRRFRYEDLVEDPAASLSGVAAFLLDREPTEVDRSWAAEVAPEVRKPTPKFPRLAASERERLERAVAASMELLGYG